MKQLTILICSNRSAKDYPYLQDFTEEDWKVVRDPITDKCSKVTIDKYLSQPVFSFLFAWFATIPEWTIFAKEEFKKKKD